ncbi:hypothetical protein [Deinococcus sp.]|uniref:hypothetical protein n=1 Tax=Deinococcus sp. TaxID=47478 RepID=UPI003B5A47E6
MRFVHKPRPYSGGPLGSIIWPRRSAQPRRLNQRRPAPQPSQPSTQWGGRGVTGLALLGVLITALILGSALNNQLGREAQFASVGDAVANLRR